MDVWNPGEEKSRREKKLKKKQKKKKNLWLIRFDRAKRNDQGWARPLRILIWGDPTMLSEAKRWPPFFSSGPAGRRPTVFRPSVAFVQFHLSTLARCPDIRLDIIYIFGTSDFISGGLQHGTDVVSMLKRRLIFRSFNFLWPLDVGPKGSTFSSPGRDLLFPWVVFLCRYRAAVGSERGIEDFALAFWLAPFQFRVFFFFLYTYTHSLPSWFFFRVVYCRSTGSSLTHSRISFKLGIFYLNGERKRESHRNSIRVRFSSTENETHSRRQS